MSTEQNNIGCSQGASTEPTKEQLQARAAYLEAQLMKLTGIPRSEVPAASHTVIALTAIAAERRRQIEVEDWSPDHDDEHSTGDLACAAACYALPEWEPERDDGDFAPRLWPWDPKWWKPGDGSRAGRLRELEKAGALLIAEYERQLRGTERPS